MKSLFFLLKRFNLSIFNIINFHSDIGHNSKHLSKTERFNTKPSCKEAFNCFFKGYSKSKRPLASTLHSYVPIIEFNICLFNKKQKYKKFYHILPLFTTLLISFPTCHFQILIVDFLNIKKILYIH